MKMKVNKNFIPINYRVSINAMIKFFLIVIKLSNPKRAYYNHIVIQIENLLKKRCLQNLKMIKLRKNLWKDQEE